jgi:hypothetical protein
MAEKWPILTEKWLKWLKFANPGFYEGKKLLKSVREGLAVL